jgi:hypothetical protein
MARPGGGCGQNRFLDKKTFSPHSLWRRIDIVRSLECFDAL